jgi:hypothetical protein
MAGIINTGSFSKLLWPGLNTTFGEVYSQYETEYDKVFEQKTSQKAYEEDLGLSMFGLAKVKAQGASIEYDSAQQGFLQRYQHVVYGLGFAITREMMEDNQYMEPALKNARALAWSLRETKEQIHAGILNQAFAGAGNPTYADGLSMINSAHPNAAGGTQSNTMAVQSDLSEAALEQAFLDISLWTDDRGKLIAIRPKKLIIPPQLQFEAHRILKTENRVGTDANDTNAIRQMGAFAGEPELMHRLTAPDAWFITTTAQNGLTTFNRRAAEFEEDNDFPTENALFKATERYSAGITDWRGIYGSAGA